LFAWLAHRPAEALAQPGVVRGIVRVRPERVMLEPREFSVPEIGCPPEKLRAAAFDGDGCADLLIRSFACQLLLPSDCRSGFRPVRQAHLPPPADFDRLAIGDFNGDGRADWAAPEGSAGAWTEALSNGNDDFDLSHPILFAVPDRPLRIFT